MKSHWIFGSGFEDDLILSPIKWKGWIIDIHFALVRTGSVTKVD